MLYSIGDFAKALGVTPDLLKYCEKKGLIQPVVAANGYRSYDFRQSAPVLEYLKLKNQGYTASEILSQLHAFTYAEGLQQSTLKVAKLEKTISFQQALLRHHEKLLAYANQPKGSWYILPSHPFYFLPHAINNRFIESEDVLTCVREWSAYLPVVFSAASWALDQPENFCWGFAVSCAFASEVSLPVTKAVSTIPAGRSLEYYSIRPCNESTNTQDFQNIREILTRNHLKPQGQVYEFILKKLMEDGVRQQYSIIRLPLMPS